MEKAELSKGIPLMLSCNGNWKIWDVERLKHGNYLGRYFKTHQKAPSSILTFTTNVICMKQPIAVNPPCELMP